LFPPNLFFFMAGSLSYVIYKNHQDRLRAIASSKPWIFVIFGLLALEYCRFPFTRQLYLVWMPLIFVMVPLLFAVTCRNRLDRLIGELSYPAISSTPMCSCSPFRFCRPPVFSGSSDRSASP